MSSQRLQTTHLLFLGWLTASAAQAAVYPLPPPDTDVVGQVRVIYATKDDTLVDIARKQGLGYDEIVHANPGLDRWAPGEGTPVVLPTRHILPDTPREGIILNIAEMRLYYYPKPNAGEEAVVITYPVSIGRMDWKTPMGLTKVVAKTVDAPWRPPASIKAEHAKEGDILPDVVPGGPDNPMGRYAMRLGVPGYLIHGTNKPYGIGMRVTHGCVRMYPEDIERLFGMVPVGTPVRLVDQPVKVGRINGELYLEAHEPLEEDNIPIKVSKEQARQAVVAKAGPDMPGVDQAALEVAIEQLSGMPVSIAAGYATPAGLPAAPSRPLTTPMMTAPAGLPAAPSRPVATTMTAPAGSASGLPTAPNRPMTAPAGLPAAPNRPVTTTMTAPAGSASGLPAAPNRPVATTMQPARTAPPVYSNSTGYGSPPPPQMAPVYRQTTPTTPTPARTQGNNPNTPVAGNTPYSHRTTGNPQTSPPPGYRPYPSTAGTSQPHPNPGTPTTRPSSGGNNPDEDYDNPL